MFVAEPATVQLLRGSERFVAVRTVYWSGALPVKENWNVPLVCSASTRIGEGAETNVVVLWAGRVAVKLPLATGMPGCWPMFRLDEVTVGIMNGTDMPEMENACETGRL